MSLTIVSGLWGGRSALLLGTRRARPQAEDRRRPGVEE